MSIHEGCFLPPKQLISDIKENMLPSQKLGASKSDVCAVTITMLSAPAIDCLNILLSETLRDPACPVVLPSGEGRKKQLKKLNKIRTQSHRRGHQPVLGLCAPSHHCFYPLTGNAAKLARVQGPPTLFEVKCRVFMLHWGSQV